MLRLNVNDDTVYELARRTMVEYMKYIYQLTKMHKSLVKVYNKLLIFKSSKHISYTRQIDFIVPLNRLTAFTTISLLSLKKYLFYILTQQNIIKGTISDNNNSVSFINSFSKRYDKLTDEIGIMFFSNKENKQQTLINNNIEFSVVVKKFGLILKHFTMNLQLMMMWCFEIKDNSCPIKSSFIEVLVDNKLNKEDKMNLKWEIINIKLLVKKMKNVIEEETYFNEPLVLKLQYKLIHKHLIKFLSLIFGDIEKVDIEYIVKEWEHRKDN